MNRSEVVPLITRGEALPISIFGIGVCDSLYVFFSRKAGRAASRRCRWRWSAS